MGDRLAIRRSYDAIAQTYADELGAELAGKPLDRALLAAFAETTSGGIVADVGCGPAHVAAHLVGHGARAVGFDLSPGMCAVARRTSGVPVAAADATRLPVRSGSLAGLVSLYTVIHLDDAGRAAAYREFARVLRRSGTALVAFHVSDAGTAAGGSATLAELLGHAVELTFHYLDPDVEIELMAAAGLQLRARLDREPHPGSEHESRRCYLMVGAPA